MRLLTVGDLAQLLQVSPGHVYRLIHQRRVPFCKVGGAVRFRPEAIELWIQRSEVRSVPFARGRSGPGRFTRGPAGCTTPEAERVKAAS